MGQRVHSRAVAAIRIRRRPGTVPRHYGAMKNYIAFLDGRATNHIVNYGLGDW